MLTRGYLIAFLSALILSTTALFIRYLTQTFQLPPLVLAFWRDLIVTVSLGGFLLVLRRQWLRVNRVQFTYLALFGFVLAIFNSLWTLSVALNGAAISTVLAYSSAGFTALLARWFLKESLGPAKVAAVLLSITGTTLVANALNPAAWLANPLGIAAGVLSGLFYAVYSLMGRSASQRGIQPWTTLLYTFAFAAGWLLVFNLVPGAFPPGAAHSIAGLFHLGGSLPGWSILVLLAVGPTLAGFGLYNVSLALLPSSVANLIATSEPVFTAILAYFLFAELLTPVQIGGSVLILLGVVVLRLFESSGSVEPVPNPNP